MPPPAPPVVAPPRLPGSDDRHDRFDGGSARISNIAKARLDAVALRLRENPRATVVITGYPDEEPRPRAANRWLVSARKRQGVSRRPARDRRVADHERDRADRHNQPRQGRHRGDVQSLIQVRRDSSSPSLGRGFFSDQTVSAAFLPWDGEQRDYFSGRLDGGRERVNGRSASSTAECDAFRLGPKRPAREGFSAAAVSASGRMAPAPISFASLPTRSAPRSTRTSRRCFRGAS